VNVRKKRLGYSEPTWTKMRFVRNIYCIVFEPDLSKICPAVLVLKHGDDNTNTTSHKWIYVCVCGNDCVRRAQASFITGKMYNHISFLKNVIIFKRFLFTLTELNEFICVIYN
jgi:hypothetical protein